MTSLELEKGVGARSHKAVIKKKSCTKFGFINIIESQITRGAFIAHFLTVHDLADQFSLGVHNGPPFKFWWTGSRWAIFLVCSPSLTHFASSGKAGTVSIESDADFQVAIEVLSKKNQAMCNIEFSLAGLEGWRIRKPASTFI
jgi:hypothetical protein